MPHSEIIRLEPDWVKMCTSIIDNIEGQRVTYGLVDPPIALTPKPVLRMTSLPPGPEPGPEPSHSSFPSMFEPSTTFKLEPPQAITSPSLPKPTAIPIEQGPSSTPVKPPSSGGSENVPVDGGSNRPSSGFPSPPANEGSNLPANAGSHPPADLPGGGDNANSPSNGSPDSHFDLPSNDDANPPADGGSGAPPNSPSNASKGIGSIIISIFDPPVAASSVTRTIDLPNQPSADTAPITLTTAIDGKFYTLTLLPSTSGAPAGSAPNSSPVLVVSGSTLASGGAPATRADGGIMSVAADGDLVVIVPPAGRVSTIITNGYSFTVIPGTAAGDGKVLVDGKTITRGGPAATVGGTVYSIDGNGNLVTGTGTPAAQVGKAAYRNRTKHWGWTGMVCIGIGLML